MTARARVAAMVGAALAIVGGGLVWSAREPRTTGTEPSSDVPTTRAVVNDSSSSIQQQAGTVLAALHAGDMAALAKLAHPERGVRFTPYAYVRPDSDLRIPPDAIAKLWTDTTRRVWGTSDGSGDPIRLSFRDYYRRFVYDHDYRNAPRVAYDGSPIGRGNTPNNIAATYPGSSIVEFHFPGFDARYNGMDWTSLWLVFQRDGARLYLVGIVHGSWTI